ncbi:uncharacterized protein LOC115217944 [Octopus sinensis]|uniref:Uncharacterized protein LOC115217944 n=1 Tax=Octopus sinensis TaxID=2607531 RepID=A0A6P7SYN2_9MOLL|nr:uncharacterized protein LOC115217944 [Octopus sinensis]
MPRPSNVASTTTENLSVPGPSWTVTTTITENLNVPGPSRPVAKTVLENPHVDRHSTKPNYHSEKYEHFYTYKIHGQCYHEMGSLRPIPGKEPTFMQVSFVGGHDEELAIRKKNNPKLEQRVIEVLQMMLHQTHPYVREFKNAMDTLDSQPHLKLVIHADKTPAGEHPGRFNAPTTNEVAALMVDEVHGNRDIILRHRDEDVTFVSELHRCYDCLQYPLLFPHGEDGYHLEIQKVDPTILTLLDKKVSCKAFYAY